MELVKKSDNIVVIDNFLSTEACLDLIEFSEARGFNDADIHLGGDERKILTGIRNNQLFDYENNTLATAWWTNLSGLDLPNFKESQPIGLSPFFRFYKYLAGHRFNMHKDGRQQVGSNQTYFTFMVYLSEGFEGGSTRFRQDNIEVIPKIGTALLFEHHLWHQGVSVEQGIKYVVRTDIVYQSCEY